MTDKESQSKKNALRKEAKGEFTAHVEPIEKSKLGRFFRRINQFFLPKSEPEIQLKGRIHELQQNADAVLSELMTVKKELKTEIDPSLLAHVESVVDPLIKEVKRIQKEIKKNEPMTQYLQIFKRYTAWIEKAKWWVELCSKRNKKEGITKAVIEHNIHEFNAIVDRDLQVINDYFSHMLDHYRMEEMHKLDIKKKLEQDLRPYINGLNQLQQKPHNLSLNDLSSWRNEYDQRRDKHFSEALHIIDALMQKENPNVFDEEEGEHFVDILLKIAALEEKVEDLAKLDFTEAGEKKAAYQILAQLEQEAHQLNVDLRLSHENSERLQLSMQQIAEIRQKLEEE